MRCKEGKKKSCLMLISKTWISANFLQKLSSSLTGTDIHIHPLKRIMVLFPENINQWHIIVRGLPWWSSGKESTCQCKENGFDPWSRKISHAVEQLSLCATTTEHHSYWAQAREPGHSATREAITIRTRTAAKRSPHLPQLEKAHAQQQSPSTTNNNYNK